MKEINGKRFSFQKSKSKCDREAERVGHSLREERMRKTSRRSLLGHLSIWAGDLGFGLCATQDCVGPPYARSMKMTPFSFFSFFFFAILFVLYFLYSDQTSKEDRKGFLNFVWLSCNDIFKFGTIIEGANIWETTQFVVRFDI